MNGEHRDGAGPQSLGQADTELRACLPLFWLITRPPSTRHIPSSGNFHFPIPLLTFQASVAEPPFPRTKLWIPLSPIHRMEPLLTVLRFDDQSGPLSPSIAKPPSSITRKGRGMKTKGQTWMIASDWKTEAWREPLTCPGHRAHQPEWPKCRTPSIASLAPHPPMRGNWGPSGL